MFLAKLKEECLQNFDSELEVKWVKLISYHVPQKPLFLNEKVWSKTTHFYEKYIKIN